MFRSFFSVYLSIGVLFAVTASSCGSDSSSAQQKSSGPPALTAEAIVVRPMPLKASYKSSGNLIANESVQVFAESPGRVTKVYFKEGSHVRKGQLLVQLFDEDVRAQIDKIKAQRRLQTTTLDRQQQLMEINGISRQEFDQTQSTIATLDADLAYYEAQLRKLQVRAPFSGVIGLRHISPGAILNTNTLITTIQQLDPLKMDFALPEQYHHVVRAGDQVGFTVTGIRDTLHATIATVSPAADQETRTLTVRALIPNPKENLLPGVFAQVFVPLSRKEDAIVIPSQCVIPTTRDKKAAVVRHGKAQLVTIETGLRLVDNIEILHGLEPGDTVLTTGIMQVKSGMPVVVSAISPLQPGADEPVAN